MARNVFFSFDFDDVRAVNVVRNSNVVKPKTGNLTFRDYSLYEQVKATDESIKRAINAGLEGTTVTVVLIGGETWKSYWARYEIAKSVERGNGFLVIDIEGVGPGTTPMRGSNPLEYLALYPWESRKGFGIQEWNGTNWQSYPVLSDAASCYPGNMMPSRPMKLSEIFTQRDHWRAAQMFFGTMVDTAASATGH